jgi:DNA invertase Pin-like site-specific DNA recombinase
MQERDGVSLDAQVDMARSFCQARGFDLIETLYDTMSGQKDSRPGLARLEAMVKAKAVDHVLVYKIDRLSRDPAHYHALLNTFSLANIGLASLTERIDCTDSSGRFMLGMLILLAAMEADRISDRGKDSIAYRAKQGRLLIGKECPAGYKHHKAHTNAQGERVPGWLEVEVEDALMVRYLFEHYADAHTIRRLTLDAIAAGFTMPSGRPLNQQGVRRILMNPLYSGQYAALKTRTIGTGSTKRVVDLPRSEWLIRPTGMPAIVPQPLWDSVQAQLLENSRMAPRSRASKLSHPWSGLIRCGHCDAAMVRSGAVTTKATHHGRYTCQQWAMYREAACKGPIFLSEAFLDAFVLPILCDALDATYLAKSTHHARKPPALPDTSKALGKLQEQRRRVIKQYDHAHIDDDTYFRRMKEIDTELAQLTAKQVPTERPTLPTLPRNLSTTWPTLGRPKQGQVLRLLLERVTVHRGTVVILLKPYDLPGWSTEPITLPIINMRSKAGRERAGR